MAPRSTHKHFMAIATVHFGRARIANMNQHYLAETDSLSLGTSQQERPGPTGTPGKAVSCVSLSEAKISEDSKPRSVTQLAP